MSSRHLSRVALHFLLAVALVVPGIAAPAQAIVDGLQAIADASAANVTAMTLENMPCDDAGMPVAPDESAPCDCCVPHVCEFSTCLGTACLTQLPRVAAVVPAAAMPLPWQPPAMPPNVVDTPLRPPIA